jgi:adenine phosphoribosyltransferase
MVDVGELKRTIREIPDFPKPGITFYDVSTLFRNAAAFRAVVHAMADALAGRRVDALAGIEARGLVLASALAHELGRGIVLVRKRGKLPAKTAGERYQLEYGESEIEIHEDAVSPGEHVWIVDDLLATGGTAAAAARLLERCGAQVAGYAFMVELDFLNGRAVLPRGEVLSLIHYGAGGL